MRKRVPCCFGQQVLIKLMESGMTQVELIAAVQDRTQGFFDGGYLYKILTGQRNAPKITQAIREILELPEDKTSAN